MRKAIEAGRGNGSLVSSGPSGTRQELMRFPSDYASQTGISDYRNANDNDDFISSESDRQQLLIRYLFLHCIPFFSLRRLLRVLTTFSISVVRWLLLVS